MDTAHPRSSWEQLGDKWFRRVQHYTEVFDQDLDLDNYIIAAAPYGGAIGAFTLSFQSRSLEISTRTA